MTSSIIDRLLQAPTGLYAVEDEALLEALEDGLHDNDAAAVRVVEGKVCRNKASLLGHFAETLDFPEYFGHNWDAFHDSLADFDPRPSPQFALLIDDADDLLVDQPDQLDILMDSLVELSAPMDAEHPERGMKVVLRVDDAGTSRAVASARKLADVSVLV